MKLCLFAARLRGQRAASAVELAIIMALLVVVLWQPLRLLISSFQGDAVLIQQVDSAYQSLANQSFGISEMGPNAHLRRGAGTTGVLRSVADRLYGMSQIDGFCALALEYDSGIISAFASSDRNSNDCPAGTTIPPKVLAAFEASIDPFAGRTHAVAAYNTTPSVDQEFALYKASTQPSSVQ